MPVLLLLFGIRPRVEVSDGCLTLHNIRTVVRLPIDAIEQVDHTGKLTRIKADGHWHTAWALENYNYELAADQDPTGLSDALAEAGPSAPGAATTVRRRKLEAPDLLVLGTLLAYVGASAITTYTGVSPAPFN